MLCKLYSVLLHTLIWMNMKKLKSLLKPIIVQHLNNGNSFDDKQVFIKLMDNSQTINNFTNLDFSILDDRYKGDTYKVNLNTNFAV